MSSIGSELSGPTFCIKDVVTVRGEISQQERQVEHLSSRVLSDGDVHIERHEGLLAFSHMRYGSEV